MRFAFGVRGQDGLAASGNVVIAFASPDAGSVPWPDRVREALGDDGAGQRALDDLLLAVHRARRPEASSTL
jgi:hypothetical protein